jgi:pimeloyl-ACP methyl ester carboxylesterase
MPELQLTQGTLNYRDEGEGPAVVFIHGLLVNGRVWDDVIPLLGTRVRRIVPDLPLGSHTIPMRPDATLDPPALAGMIAELIERLDLTDVTLVGNDTGGALCQLVVAQHPDRIGKLLLINCDAFENFPPRAFAPALTMLRRVPGLLALVGALGRTRTGRRMAMKTAPLTVIPIRDELVQSWVGPLRRRGVRRDALKVMRAIAPEHTLGAVDGLRRFERPAIIVWGLRDVFFKVHDGERLVQTLPQARLETVDAARTFVQLDAPDRVAQLVLELALPQAASANGTVTPADAAM